jgi:potassium-dependent mechanosensitive channel
MFDMTMRKTIFLLFALLFLSMPVMAVLNEKNLGQTLAVLREELEMYQRDNVKSLAMGQAIRSRVHSRLLNIVNESNQIALMLYSQKMDYIFDLTYACNKATELYDDFNTMRLPFDKVLTKMEVEEARYDGLIDNLKNMPKEFLTEKELTDRDVCLTLCVAMKHTLQNQTVELKEYQNIYQKVSSRLKKLNDYAIKRYNNIRQSIFVNGDETYIDVLANLPSAVQRAKYSIHEKYSSTDSHTSSQWRGPVVVGWFFFMIFYAMIAVAVNLLFIKFAMPKRFKTQQFNEKKTYVIMASTTITFALVLMVLWLFVLKHNFFIMACKLLVQYAWLLAVILVSMLVRLDGSQIKDGFRIYLPLIITGFIVITCRIIFIPNEMVNLCFPVLILLTTVWQLYETLRRHHNIPRSDMVYSAISLLVMVAGVITAWMGYTLLSVQLLIWWIMQFTCIQTITCIYDILEEYRKKHIKKGKSDIRQTWGYDFVRNAMVPVIMASSVFFSFYMATEVFSLSEICKHLFTTNFIDITGVARINLTKILIVFSSFHVVKYIVYVYHSFFLLYYGGKKKIVTGEKALVLKLTTFVIWFLYVVISMLCLHISTSGILVAMGGLSTGIGFAMKDTLENLFYGISLMTGRLHIGDIVECDGVRGQVVDISYQSTMIEALDGSIIAFLNNQLFSKNFKNLTRNHHYEIVQIPVDVAYGTDIEKARAIMTEAIEKIETYDKARGFRIVVKELGESGVQLRIVIWVPVATKLYVMGDIYESVYNAFNSNGISMPFPQRDIHLDLPDENKLRLAFSMKTSDK